jgi:hypothetical protein
VLLRSVLDPIPKMATPVAETFTTLPVLSIAAARDPTRKAQFLSELRNALLHVGFLYISETGISDDLLEQVCKQVHLFFDETVLPLSEKEKIEMKNEKSFLGWSRVSQYVPIPFFCALPIILVYCARKPTNIFPRMIGLETEMQLSLLLFQNGWWRRSALCDPNGGQTQG